MAIIEKLSHDDLILYELVRHPILLGEFYRQLDIPEWKEDEWEYTNYQREYIGDFNDLVSLCCGRSVGKTEALKGFILWVMLNNIFDGDYILYTVPNKVHLEPVFFGLTKDLRNNDLLKHYLEGRRGINASNYTIKLMNNARLMCRIAGQSGTGANVVGLHTPMILLDEAGYYPWGTWMELQPVLNTWQDGSKLFVSGVPTGLRENNVLFYADEVDDNFNHHRTSAHENPRYTDADEQSNIKKYGGVDSEDYTHFVLGRHGSPVHSVFDRRLMQIDTYPVYKVKFSGIDLKTYTEMINRLATIPRLPPDRDVTIMGIDLGYTDPTSIVILYEYKGKIREHARIVLQKVEYPMQERLIDYLDTKFENPEVIGVDAGSSGKAVTQALLGEEKFIHKNYPKRLYPVEFGSWISLGESIDGEEIKMKVKPYSVTTLQEYTNSHRIIYSTTDMDLVTEMERMTYTKTTTGDLSFRTMTPGGGKRGDDHNTSAMLCAVMAYWAIQEGFLFSNKKPDLAGSRWMRG